MNLFDNSYEIHFFVTMIFPKTIEFTLQMGINVQNVIFCYEWRIKENSGEEPSHKHLQTLVFYLYNRRVPTV